MTYANVLFPTVPRTYQTSRDIGIDGFILPDIPYEEKEFDGSAKNDRDLIS